MSIGIAKTVTRNSTGLPIKTNPIQTPSQELKLLLRKHRWAFEELVYDNVCKAWNQITSQSTLKAYQAIERRKHDKTELSLVKYGKTCIKGFQIPPHVTDDKVGKYIRRHFPVVIEEYLMELMERETKWRWEKASRMWSYLRKFQSTKDILCDIRWLVTVQRKRLKSLRLKSNDTH